MAKGQLLKKIDMYGLKHAVIIIFILFLGVEEGGVNILHFTTALVLKNNKSIYAILHISKSKSSTNFHFKVK